VQDKRNFPDISEKGVYCLIFRNGNCVLDAGRLKNIEFSKGYHVYVGSALGTGGLKRLKRHVLLSLEKNKKPRWHVDYLSVSQEFELISVVYAITDEPFECELAGRLEYVFNNQIRGFGAGDCGCSSHLFYSKKRPVFMIKDAFTSTGLKSKVAHFV
jgi:Uri superfamily endonuclease